MKALLAFLAALVLPLIATDALAQDGYRIRAGDTLRIEVLEDPSLSRAVLVAPDGRITMPLVGGVMAQGRQVEELQNDLEDRLAPNFAARPSVFVSLQGLGQRDAAGQIAPADLISVYVLGEANRPGRIDVERGTTLLQFFAQMGGFSDFAAEKRVQLRRTDPETGEETIYNLNYKSIERGQSKTGATVLADGDVILVPQRGLFE
jgi:polysaccharide export outer membrane protein